jgi:hypothetical protein
MRPLFFSIARFKATPPARRAPLVMARGRASTQLALSTVRECLAEMRAFARGGLPGRARLLAVLPSLFAHFEIPAPMHADLVHQCGLRPFYDVVRQRTAFYLFSGGASSSDDDEA